MRQVDELQEDDIPSDHIAQSNRQPQADAQRKAKQKRQSVSMMQSQKIKKEKYARSSSHRDGRGNKTEYINYESDDSDYEVQKKAILNVKGSIRGEVGPIYADEMSPKARFLFEQFPSCYKKQPVDVNTTQFAKVFSKNQITSLKSY